MTKRECRMGNFFFSGGSSLFSGRTRGPPPLSPHASHTNTNRTGRKLFPLTHLCGGFTMRMGHFAWWAQ